MWEGAKTTSKPNLIADDEKEATVVVKADFQTNVGREIENVDHKNLAKEVKKCLGRGICGFYNWRSWEELGDGKSLIRFYVIVTARSGFGKSFIMDKSNWPAGIESLVVKDV